MNTRLVSSVLVVCLAGFGAAACGEVSQNPDAAETGDATQVDAFQLSDAFQLADAPVNLSPDGSVTPDAGVTPDANLTPDATLVPPCTIGNDCAMVGGRRIHRVPMNVGTNGNAVCAAANLTCVNAPVLSPPTAACTTFHPGATVTSSVNGWREGIYCNGSASGLACNFQVKCHSCPACNAGNLNCSTGSSSNLSEVFVECQ